MQQAGGTFFGAACLQSLEEKLAVSEPVRHRRLQLQLLEIAIIGASATRKPSRISSFSSGVVIRSSGSWDVQMVIFLRLNQLLKTGGALTLERLYSLPSRWNRSCRSSFRASRPAAWAGGESGAGTAPSEPAGHNSSPCRTHSPPGKSQNRRRAGRSTPHWLANHQPQVIFIESAVLDPAHIPVDPGHLQLSPSLGNSSSIASISSAPNSFRGYRGSPGNPACAPGTSPGGC